MQSRSAVSSQLAQSAAPTTGTTSAASTDSTPPSPLVVGGVRLYPVPRVVAKVCAGLASRYSVPVICPSVLPRPSPELPTTPAQRRFRADVYGPAGRYDLVVGYGAPYEDPAQLDQNSPKQFLHFEVIGGRDLRTVVAWGTRLQHDLGETVIAGHHGHLYYGRPYSQGGGNFSDHLTFVWHQCHVGYATSLHSWPPRSETLALLRAVTARLVPERSC